LIEQSGGLHGVRDLGLLEAALVQPRQTFAGQPLYPTLVDQVACLGFSLIQNHAFLDGNKRIGHAALETTLILNGYELNASVDQSEAVVLAVASSQMDRQAFIQWVAEHMAPLQGC
jgi:death-on-curing protein